MIPPILRSGGEGSTLEMLVKGDCCRFRRWDLLFLRKCCDSGIMADTFLIKCMESLIIVVSGIMVGVAEVGVEDVDKVCCSQILKLFVKNSHRL